MNVATESVEITPRGIRKVLNKYTPQRAIAEYIWNGYDAHAKEVRVNTICENTFDSIIKVIVKDDGDGIIHEQLSVVFKKFYESHKSVKGNLPARRAVYQRSGLKKHVIIVLTVGMLSNYQRRRRGLPTK